VRSPIKPGPHSLGTRSRKQKALNTLEPVDRKVLSLRHFEYLTAAEIAAVLGIEESAAARRQSRALRRLEEILAGMPGG
jgi:RNA polymerase sigma-70 factor, ECF subfamily